MKNNDVEWRQGLYRICPVRCWVEVGPANGERTVNATVNGQPWTRNLNYTIIGPCQDAGYSVPQTSDSIPPGTYTIIYHSAFPDEQCILSAITPASTPELSSNGRLIFTLEFLCKETRAEEPGIQLPVESS